MIEHQNAPEPLGYASEHEAKIAQQCYTCLGNKQSNENKHRCESIRAMLPTRALDNSTNSSLNDSVTSSNNKARARKATPKKKHMNMSSSADESELLETSSKFDASQETAESTDSPSILDR